MKDALARIIPFLLAGLAFAATPATDSPPPNETLRYSVNWPTGLSLGEATLSASSSSKSMHLEFDLDAGAPGFPVSDKFFSDASSGFCSAEFRKVTSQGSKKVDDEEKFDANTGTVMRGTGAGQSEMNMDACGKDALTFLYFVREELSQGRMPPHQTVFFGAPYEIHLESSGTESVKIANKPVETEHVKASVEGPSSNISFDLFFLQDKARTLALVRVPLAMGTFSMELTR